ncbi:MAG: hypothetical protein K0R14_501 [Burkholderiales bacterium]|nr:hypothetical protein [Burkholderiales bacterium]
MKNNYNKNFIRSLVLFMSMLVFTRSSWADDPAPKTVIICINSQDLRDPPLLAIAKATPKIELSIKQEPSELSPVSFTLSKDDPLSKENAYCTAIKLDKTVLDNNAGNPTMHWIMKNENSIPSDHIVKIQNISKCAGSDHIIMIKLAPSGFGDTSPSVTSDTINCN